MAELHLPRTLTPLFVDMPPRVEVTATSVWGAFEQLEQRWPGVCDRLCEPGPVIRPHLLVYVDGERAALDTPLGPGSRIIVVAAISGG